jgi:hypothetical protein
MRQQNWIAWKIAKKVGILLRYSLSQERTIWVSLLLAFDNISSKSSPNLLRACHTNPQGL